MSDIIQNTIISRLHEIKTVEAYLSFIPSTTHPSRNQISMGITDFSSHFVMLTDLVGQSMRNAENTNEDIVRSFLLFSNS